MNGDFMKFETIATIIIIGVLSYIAADQYAQKLEVVEALKICEDDTVLDKILDKYRKRLE